MHSIRSAKAYYIAAFLLGAIIALLIAAPIRGAEIPASADSFQRAASQP